MTYQSPGVYIEEVPSGPQPIAAASTSVMAVIGRTRQGPLMKPTRVTGWSDFVRMFGSALEGGYTAESVYGFFENGGPAAWIVRVDPSLSAKWQVKDTADAASFEVAASSPGAWANALSIDVTPDTTGGSGATYRAAFTAAASIVGTASTALQVASTVGVKVGDKVSLVKSDGSVTKAIVDTVGASSISVTKTGGATLALAIGDMVAGRADNGDTVINLAAGSGIKAGDLFVAELADGTRTSGIVQTTVSAGAGLVVTLTAGLGADVPGVTFTDRVARFKGTVAGASGNTLALSAITWLEDSALKPQTTDLVAAKSKAYASNGLVGTWGGVNLAFPTGVTPPDGPIEVEAQLKAVLYEDTGISLTNPTPADVAARFGFLPEGTAIVLSDGANTATFTKTAGVFTTGDSTAHTFTSATFDLPNDVSKGVVVRCARSPRKGDRILIGTNLLEITSVDTPGGTIYVLGFTATTDVSAVTATRYALKAFEPTKFFPLRFNLAVVRGGGKLEEFKGLALDPNHAQYYARDGVVNGSSALITVGARPATAGAISATTMPAYATSTQAGVDVAPSVGDYKNGLTVLEAESEPAMVICPDTVTFADPLLQADLVGAVVTHCEEFRRFAIVDAPDESDDQALLSWRNTTLSTTYAALYAPHVSVVNIDPDSKDRFRTVPSSGFVAGVFARTDRERGVHKAPGNERVRGIVGLTETYTQRRQDLLNPNSVNLIRAFPGRGTRIWGARNATDDVTWRYVNVRRLFNFIENSVERGTQWVVFEPNTASTWLRIKVSVENFLDQLWRSGALAGTSPEQAYRVRVGLGETMSETDIDLGLVITEVAVAPAKPAEFVVFRFSHKRLSE